MTQQERAELKAFEERVHPWVHVGSFIGLPILVCAPLWEPASRTLTPEIAGGLAVILQFVSLLTISPKAQAIATGLKTSQIISRRKHSNHPPAAQAIAPSEPQEATTGQARDKLHPMRSCGERFEYICTAEHSLIADLSANQSAIPDVKRELMFQEVLHYIPIRNELALQLAVEVFAKAEIHQQKDLEYFILMTNPPRDAANHFISKSQNL